MSDTHTKKTTALPVNNKTKKSPLNLSVNVPPDIDRLSLFYEYLYSNIQTYDASNPDYKITDKMLHYYITVNKLSDPWITILKSNRQLLYLDQYINFYNTYHQSPITDKENDPPDFKTLGSLSSFFSKDKTNAPINFKLNILHKTILGHSAELKNNDSELPDKIIQRCTKIYKDNLLSALELILKKINETYTCNINTDGSGIGLICSHGSIHESKGILIVPDDVIIAFVTPLNKYGYQEANIPKRFLNTLDNYRNNTNFLRNPACYLRTNNCFKNTVYFYPGQLIPNYVFTTNTVKDVKYHGFYTDDAIVNQRDIIFTDIGDNNYYANLYFLFYYNYDEIKGKIIYIHCCRKCDLDVNSSAVELLYRYEHITTYINMSRCLAFEHNKFTDIECTFNKSNKFNHSLYNNTKNNTIKKLNLFYDAALSYNFKNISEKPHKFKYMLNEYDEIPKFTNIETELAELLRNILIKYKTEPDNTKNEIFKFLLNIFRANIELLTNKSYIIDIYNELKKYIDMIQLIKIILILNKQNTNLFKEYINDLQNKHKSGIQIEDDLTDDFIKDACSMDIFGTVILLLNINVPVSKIYRIFKTYFEKKLNADNLMDSESLQTKVHAELTNLFTNVKLNLTKPIKFNFLIAYITEFIKNKNSAEQIIMNKNDPKIKKINTNKLNTNKLKAGQCQKYYETPEYINDYLNAIIDKITYSFDTYPPQIKLGDFYKEIKCMPLITIKIITKLETKFTVAEQKLIDDYFEFLLSTDMKSTINPGKYKEALDDLYAYKPELFNTPDRLKLIGK